MQACPYDALYIDPETQTAAKCNYCAHRVDVGLEPACVNVCPEHAIISGDMENPDTEIAQLLAREQVTARKTDKGTLPNLFYINGDEASLNPRATDRSDAYFWNSQSRGVGHFSRYVEERPTNPDVLALAKRVDDVVEKAPGSEAFRQVDVLLGKPRRTYDTPDKGLLWGREVWGYVWTKAISSGIVLAYGLCAIGMFGDAPALAASLEGWVVGFGLVFLMLTGVLLVSDLDQPKRFAYVLLRPQWNSWLVRGGYLITGFGAVLALWGAALFLGWESVRTIARWLAIGFAFGTAIYTAFLFAQAKGRDFWQSPVLALHMLIHAVMAGAALLAVGGFLQPDWIPWSAAATELLVWAIAANLLVTGVELGTTHANAAAAEVSRMLTHGFYRRSFWIGMVLLGNLLPVLALGLLAQGNPTSIWVPIGAVLVLGGLLLTERLWVEAPQRLPLS